MSANAKVFVRVTSCAPNSNGTESWLQLDTQCAVMHDDGTMVDLTPIGTTDGRSAPAIRLEYADSWQDIQRKIAAKIEEDLAYMADNGGADLSGAHLHFEFIGG